MTEYVIKGNAAVLKCTIPSFVADFVQVESWIDEEGKVYQTNDAENNDYGVIFLQKYYRKIIERGRGRKFYDLVFLDPFLANSLHSYDVSAPF